MKDVLELLDEAHAQTVGDGLGLEVVGYGLEGEVRIEGEAQCPHDSLSKVGLTRHPFREVNRVALCRAEGGLAQNIEKAGAAAARRSREDEGIREAPFPVLYVLLHGGPVGRTGDEQGWVLDGAEREEASVHERKIRQHLVHRRKSIYGLTQGSLVDRLRTNGRMTEADEALGLPLGAVENAL